VADLIIVVTLSVALVPLIELSEGALRIALGLVFALFSPGYCLIASLFPRMTSLDGIERVALSFGLSIAVVPLIGLLLNYTPWGIRLYPILISVLVFIVAMAAVAGYRRWRLAPEDRFRPRIQSKLGCLTHYWAGQRRLDIVLNVVLVIAILGAVGTLIYVIAQPRIGERFSEFYILGLRGRAEDYPREIVLGESGSVILGIVNNEHRPTAYRVEIAIHGQRVEALASVLLEHGDRWEENVSFSPARAGPDQKVEFLLFKGEEEDVYLTTHLWVDVKHRP